MAANPPVPLRGFIQNAINEIMDKNRLSGGIDACSERSGDFSGDTEMKLAGIAMVPEARQLVSDRLTEYWSRQAVPSSDQRDREVIFGGGFHAAVYAATRVRMGFPRPVVLERNTAEAVGGAFAMSLSPVFRLNSRSRPGTVGLPDQDKALNYLPGALIQPSMMSSEEYPTNADMAWVIRLTLAQYADVCPGVTLASVRANSRTEMRLTTSTGATLLAGRVLDARGLGDERAAGQADGERILTFSQLMARMGGMFPLRGIKQVAVIGAGNSGLCAAESLLGIAPGHTSAIGLDYVQRVDLYTGGRIDGRTCEEFRARSRGRYIRAAQFLEGNVSQPTTRLKVISDQGNVTPFPDGVLVNDRVYDMAVLCTGSKLPPLDDNLGYYPAQRTEGSTALGLFADPYPSYRIGVAANLGFSDGELDAGVAEIGANRVSMFRLAPRTAGLAAMLPALPDSSDLS